MSNKNKPAKSDFTIEFKHSAAKLVIEKGYTHQKASEGAKPSYRV